VVKALMRAAERGKQVAVLIEVTARFDEANNIRGAEMLEDAGVHVTYGLVGLKTHSKVTLIVRDEGGPPRCLLPHRHRQLPREDLAAVHRPGAADLLATRSATTW
jgi:hypothetical protein